MRYNKYAFKVTTLIAIATNVAYFFSVDISNLTAVTVQTLIGFVSLIDKEDIHMDKKQIWLVGIAFGVDTFCWRVRVRCNRCGFESRLPHY
jgi:hypothetical protein